MSSVPLSADDLRRRVAGTVGRLDAGALTQSLMRPERGCVSLVSIRSFSYLASGCLRFSQSGFPLVSRSWGVTSLPCHRSQRTRWTEPRGGSPRRRKRRRRTRKRPGPASGCGLGMPWRSVVDGRRGTGSRGSRHRRRLMMTTTMMMKTTTWPPALASARILGLARGRQTIPQVGPVLSVFGAGASGSRPEEQGQAEGVFDPLAQVAEVTPGSQAVPPAPPEPLSVPAAEEADPRVASSVPRRTVPSAPRAPEAGMVPKPVAGKTLVVPVEAEARGASPRARLVVARSG